MEILNNFGFQPTLFIAQIVNFLILAYVFKRFLYKPILKTLKDRQKTMKRTVQVMAPSDDESFNSDQSDAEEFATPTTKEPLKKRMLFKKK